MATDFRRDWIKNRVTQLFGLESGDYFEEMLAKSDDLEDQLASFLDDDFLKKDESLKRFFYVFRTSYEKLVDEEILVPEVGK